MAADPFKIFSTWYSEAQDDAPTDPDIIALATSTRDGRPSVRMVLYRGIREGGFSFFTNYESRKGRELAENPFAAIVFHWQRLGKQIRIEGRVERLSSDESDAYFRQRPLPSQVTAIASKQSRVMTDENEFLVRLSQLEASAAQAALPRPAGWGGFTLLPSRFEFWSHADHRRHRRILFEKSGLLWNESRLYP